MAGKGEALLAPEIDVGAAETSKSTARGVVSESWRVPGGVMCWKSSRARKQSHEGVRGSVGRVVGCGDARG
jgi:hypothetical protein